MEELLTGVFEFVVSPMGFKLMNEEEREVSRDLEGGIEVSGEGEADVVGDPHLNVSLKRGQDTWQLGMAIIQQSMLFYAITFESFILDLAAGKLERVDEIQFALFSDAHPSPRTPLSKRRVCEGPHIRFDFAHHVDHRYEDAGVVRSCSELNLLHFDEGYEFDPEEYEALHPRGRRDTV